VSGRKIGVGALVVRYAARLRFPYLFLATAILFIGDLIFPDLVPFADEILLGLLTALFGTWRRRRVSGSKNLAPDGGVAGPYDRQESD
jgi:hypothetical protein